MKKLIGLGLAVALFASCSDDDGGIDKNKLMGKWYNVSTNANGETELYDDHEVCGKDYIEFASGGIFRSVDVYGCEGTAAVSDTETGTYTTSGNKLTVGFSGENVEGEDTVTVTKLTASELKISYRDDDDGDGDEETIIVTYTSTP